MELSLVSGRVEIVMWKVVVVLVEVDELITKIDGGEK